MRWRATKARAMPDDKQVRLFQPGCQVFQTDYRTMLPGDIVSKITWLGPRLHWGTQVLHRIGRNLSSALSKYCRLISGNLGQAEFVLKVTGRLGVEQPGGAVFSPLRPPSRLDLEPRRGECLYLSCTSSVPHLYRNPNRTPIKPVSGTHLERWLLLCQTKRGFLAHLSKTQAPRVGIGSVRQAGMSISKTGQVRNSNSHANDSNARAS